MDGDGLGGPDGHNGPSMQSILSIPSINATKTGDQAMPADQNPDGDPLIPRHGGYRGLTTFRIGQLIHDFTVLFSDRFVDRRDRTHDQTVQAARSGVQNTAEGSMAAGASTRTELKPTNVARASLEEPRLDYEDFLRRRGLPLREPDDPRRRELVDLRCRSAERVVEWLREVHRKRRTTAPHPSLPSLLSPLHSPMPSRQTHTLPGVSDAGCA